MFDLVSVRQIAADRWVCRVEDIPSLEMDGENEVHAIGRCIELIEDSEDLLRSAAPVLDRLYQRRAEALQRVPPSAEALAELENGLRDAREGRYSELDFDELEAMSQI